ncbi:MAG TPA: glycosyltransferase family 87 protein [Fimbriimonadales bacterium]|nr:glycosyltransferase family 87 protein [Fimbriimonadales bacterium]
MNSNDFSKLANVRSLLIKAAFIVAIVILLAQVFSLVARVHEGQTDFSVFHRAAVQLAAGAGGELYAKTDEPTGWYNCIPPLGMALFYPLAGLEPPTAAAIWGVFNVLLLLSAVYFLYRVGTRIESSAGSAAISLSAVILLLLGGACVQVGQTSIVFAVCWMGFLWAISAGRPWLAGLAAAMPVGIKLYPIAFLAAPFQLGRRRAVLTALLWIVVLLILVPLLAFGPRFWDLSISFVHYAILGPGGRLATSADPTALSNQSIDALLLRYFTFHEGFHSQAPWLPHLGLPAAPVLVAANAIRLAVLAATAIACRGVSRSVADRPVYAAAVVVGAWCAALYLILPGAKARYAVQAFPAFLPLCLSVFEALDNGDNKRGTALFASLAVCLLLLLQVMPLQFSATTLSIAAPIFLWWFCIRRAAELTSP